MLEKSRLTRPGIGPALGQRVPPRLRLARLQAQLAHELADQLRARLLAAAGQGGVQAAVQLFLAVRLEQRPYLDFQQLPPFRRGTFRP